MVYGDKYPDDVSGVVMVDVRPPAFSERIVAAPPPKSAGEPEAIQQARSEEAWEKDPPEPGGYRPNQERRRGGCEQGLRRPAAGRPDGG